MTTVSAGRCARPFFPDPARVGGDDAPIGGFTLLEVLFVIVIAVITLGIASQVYANYLERTATRRAANLFTRDLRRARMAAVQGRETVKIRFDESARNYEVVRASGQALQIRGYGEDGEVELTAIDLEMPGDSLVFNGRGVADLSEIAGSLGTATFESGSETYTVTFNSMGSARISGS